MNREEILEVLRSHKPGLADKYGVQQIGIFGSIARGEGTEKSDIDIVVVMPPNAYQVVHLKDELEQLFDASVDLVRYTKYMFAPLRQHIDLEGIYA